jgi:hypothetical protein
MANNIHRSVPNSNWIRLMTIRRTTTKMRTKTLSIMSIFVRNERCNRTRCCCKYVTKTFKSLYRSMIDLLMFNGSTDCDLLSKGATDRAKGVERPSSVLSFSHPPAIHGNQQQVRGRKKREPRTERYYEISDVERENQLNYRLINQTTKPSEKLLVGFGLEISFFSRPFFVFLLSFHFFPCIVLQAVGR